MMTLLTRRILALFFLLFLFSGCGAGTADGGNDSGDGTGSLSSINDFVYQLQGGDDGIDLAAIGETAYDLVVIDYSRDGSGDEEFTSDEIGALKDSPGGSKIVLAYMSIGEAEDYRFYFDPSWVDGSGNLTAAAPGYLAPLNPDWPGNYKVRYWDPAWQTIIFAYLDRIIDAGFDGVYLDIIDAFEFFGPDGEVPERPTAAADMIDFVIAIASYARETRGVANFLVFPQNGASLLDANGGAAYLTTVNGIGTEDTFYYGDSDEDNSLDLEHAATVTPYLDQFIAAGKTVLAIDYLQAPDKVADFYQRCRDKGYVPYASVRALDQVVINSGFEPD